MKIYCLLLLSTSFFCLASCSLKDKNKASTMEKEPVVHVDSLKLLFVGDVMCHSAQLDGALLDGKDVEYDFQPTFQHVRDYISSADLALANLELTFGGKPYRGYPSFSSPPQLADALEDCGFDVLFLANNHILDRGRKGLEGTIKLLDEKGFYHTGAFADGETRKKNYPLVVDVKGFRVAFLNYTYDTNGLVQSKPNIVNYLDTLQIKKDFKRTKEIGPDYIIAYLHWGEEYQTAESSRQRLLAKFFAENGADCIIGSHPHVVQPFGEIETSEGKTVPVMYSLGNFISNQREKYRDGGISLELLLTKEKGVITLSSVHYEPLWVKRVEEGDRFLYRIIPVNDYKSNKAKYELSKKQQSRIKQFESEIHALLTFSN